MKSSLFELIEEFSFWTRVRSSILNTIRSALHYKHSPIHKYPYHALFRRCDLFFFFFCFSLFGKKVCAPHFLRRATPLVYKEWVSFFFRPRTASRFVCPALRFIPHEPRKKKTPLSNSTWGFSIYMCTIIEGALIHL